jgi:type IV secretion system protein VirB4
MRESVSVAERLAWAEVVAPGGVLLADGGFLAGWRYRGPDALALGEAEQRLRADRVGEALLPYARGWMFHVDRIRREARGYAPEGAFPDPATRRLDEIRRAAYLGAGVHYETEHVLCATWLPPAEARARWAAWFVSGGERRGQDWPRVWAAYEAKLRELEDRLSAALRMERLDSDALLSHLYACLSGRRQWIRTPPPGTDLADLLAVDLLGGFEPRVGRLGFEDRTVLPVGIAGFPADPEAGVLDALDRLPFAFRFSSRWIPLSAEQAARRIGLRRKLWMLKRRGLLGPDGHAVRMGEDAEAALAELSGGEVRFGHYTPVVILAEPDAAQARAHAEEVLRVLRERGFAADVETVNAPEAFLGSLPGHGGYNVRRALVSTRCLGRLLPLTAVWPGTATCPSPRFPPGSPALLWARTEGSTPFRLNLHVSDVGHTLVIGPTGSGKSTLLALLVAQWRRYPGSRTAVFDVDRAALPLASASGARHYALAAGRPDAVRLQPLARLDEPAERAWAAEWLEVLSWTCRACASRRRSGSASERRCAWWRRTCPRTAR